MKNVKLVLVAMTLGLFFVFQSCQKDELKPSENEKSILPSNFLVEIPSALQGEDNTLYGAKNSKTDTLQGGEIYGHLRTFVHIGYVGAQIVQDLIFNISEYHINKPMSFTYTADEDNRLKQLVVTENASFEGKTYEFKLTIRDIGDDVGAGQNLGLEMFWNRQPVEGVAIFNPYMLNHEEEADSEVRYRIDYDEGITSNYERAMTISIDGLKLADPLSEPFSMSTLKMFVGKNGNIVSLYGNSEHPNGKFFTDETGFDWAFVAAAKMNEDIGVAEVGLPSNLLNSEDRNVILVENSIKNVFTNQIYEIWPTIDPDVLAIYLQNVDAPGFFESGHFVQGGIAPSENYEELLDIIPNLTPYNPKEINELEINF